MAVSRDDRIGRFSVDALEPTASGPTTPEYRKEQTMPRSLVGLRADRPFRFCTMHWGDVPGLVWEQPGDDPNPSADVSHPGQRSIQLTTPRDLEPARYVAPHDHEFYEIVLLRAGEAIHTTPDGRTPISRGDVFIVTPLGIHGFEDIRDVTKTNLYVEPDWLIGDLQLLWGEEGLFRRLLADALFSQPAGGRVYHLRLTEPETAACERELEDMTGEARKTRPSLALFNACFLKVLWTLNQAYQRDHAGDALPMDPVVWRAAERIERIIQEGQRFSVNEIAEEIGVTRDRFTRLFREAAGLSPRDYYQRRRVRLAAGLLLTPHASATEVAYQLGFSDSAHFARMFRRIMGVSPTAYRERQTREDPDVSLTARDS